MWVLKLGNASISDDFNVTLLNIQSSNKHLGNKYYIRNFSILYTE